MNRRRKIFVTIGVALPLVGLFAACTFPDVTFGTTNGSEAGVGAETAPEAASSSSGCTTDSGEGGSVLLEDGGLNVGDVVTRDPDATDGIVQDAASCAARCDCDDDGYLDKAKPDCGVPTIYDDAGSTKLGDCDDQDKLANPGAITFSEVVPRVNSPAPGDWNCDGKRETLFQEDFLCQGISVAGGGCTNNGTDGKFKGAVTCGTKADLYDCKSKGGLAGGCEDKAHTPVPTQKQLCK